jgi:3-oxoacid CoA-transferase subunit B
LIEVTADGLELKEVFEGFTIQEVINSTEAVLIVKDVIEGVK